MGPGRPSVLEIVNPNIDLNFKMGCDTVFILKTTIHNVFSFFVASFLPEYKVMCSWSFPLHLKHESLFPLICGVGWSRKPALIYILIAQHLVTVEPARTLARGWSLCMIWRSAFSVVETEAS